MILLGILILIYLSSMSDESAYNSIMAERSAERRHDEYIRTLQDIQETLEDKNSNKSCAEKITRKREIKDSTGRILCEEFTVENWEGIEL